MECLSYLYQVVPNENLNSKNITNKEDLQKKILSNTYKNRNFENCYNKISRLKSKFEFRGHLQQWLTE